MESATLDYELEIEELKKKNNEYLKKINDIGEMLVEYEKKLKLAESLAKDVMEFYPACTKSTYLKAFLKKGNL